MTKTVHPVLKKTGAVLLTVLVLVLVAVPAFAVALPDAPTGYVYDGANVLSPSTESYIERTGSALAEACGAEVVVATVDFTDGEDIADYAYDLFNKWGIGDKKANNGLLILLSIGAEDYYAEPGVGLTDVFTGGVLDADDLDFGALAPGSTIGSVVIFKDTGNPSTSPLLCYLDEVTGFPFATNGGEVSIPWSDGAAKILSLV